MADPDRRSTLVAAYENAAVIVAAIHPDQLARPTPCPKYDVAALIDHLVEACHRAAALGRGQAPPPGDESHHVALSDAPSRIRRTAEEAAQAWESDSALSSTFTMPWGEEYTGTILVDMYLAELATHAWDLAEATGQVDRLDRSLALPALDGARAMVKPHYRDMVEPGAPFGAEVPPPPGADDWERLAAFMGRDPRGHHRTGSGREEGASSSPTTRRLLTPRVNISPGAPNFGSGCGVLAAMEASFVNAREPSPDEKTTSTTADVSGAPESLDQLGRLFALHADDLVRGLVAAGYPDGADAVQEAFAQAVLHWRKISRYEDPLGWLRRVAINKARNRARSRRRQHALTDRLGRTAPDAVRAPPVDDDVIDAVRALPTQQREVVSLFYYSDLSIAQVAGVMSISVGTVKSHLHAARATVARALGEEQ